MSRKELDLDDVRRLLVHVHVPRRRRDRWLAWSRFVSQTVPYLDYDLRDEASRLIARRFRV